MPKTGFKIYTLGCKVNQYDSNDLSYRLIKAGLIPVGKHARLAIVNTCAVTRTAVRKCRRMVNKARAENPGAKLIIMGCWPQAYDNEIKKLEADLILGVGETEKIFNFQFSNNFKIQNSKFKISNNDTKKQWSNEIMKRTNNKSRYFLKIQDGCEQFCSYCIIPYTRGKLKSRPIREVIDEVKQAARAGYGEVVLCGIHLGLYGQNHETRNMKRETCGIKQGTDLAELLRKIIKIEKLGRIRLSSIEVTEVGDGLIELMAGSKKLCQHLHIPLQSGSDKILKLMNRPYDVKMVKRKIKKIRQAMPDMAITTDVIVGFPDETNEDFGDTCGFIKEMSFSRLHVFPFSAHEKTPAAKMPNRVGQNKIEKRARELRKLGKKLELEYRKRFAGRELEVVVEGKRIGNRYIGKTEFYFDVEFGETQIATNQNSHLLRNIVKIKI